jgi:hypothetical protein
MPTLTRTPEKLDTTPLSKEVGRNTNGSSRQMNYEPYIDPKASMRSAVAAPVLHIALT